MPRQRVGILGRRARTMGLLAVSTGLMAAALTAHGPARSALAAQADGGALVAFVNGIPDAPFVVVSVDGEAVVDELAYAQGTDGIPLDAGSHRVTVSEAGTDGAVVLIESDLTFEAGRAYVVSSFEQEEQPVLGSWVLDRSPAQPGARVQLLHLSPDTPSVDVAVEGGDVLIAGVGFTDPPAPAEVPAGTYDLEMRPAGSTEVVQRVPDVTVEEGTVSCVLGLGYLGDDGTLDLVVIVTPLNDAALPAGGVGAAIGAGPDATWPVWVLGAAALAAALAALRCCSGPVRRSPAAPAESRHR